MTEGIEIEDIEIGESKGADEKDIATVKRLIEDELLDIDLSLLPEGPIVSLGIKVGSKEYRMLCPLSLEFLVEEEVEHTIEMAYQNPDELQSARTLLYSLAGRLKHLSEYADSHAAMLKSCLACGKPVGEEE